MKDFHDPESAQALLDRQKRVERMQKLLFSRARQASRDAEATKGLWFVAQVRPYSEEAVHKTLKERKIRSYLPMNKSRKLRRRNRPVILKAGPVFRGYVFVQIVPTPYAIAALGQIRGVEGLLGHGETPTPIRDETIALIRDMVDAGVFHNMKFYGDGNVSRVGDIVAYEGEELELLNLVVQGYVKSRAVRCAANLFGGAAPITVDLDKCRRLTKSPESRRADDPERPK